MPRVWFTLLSKVFPTFWCYFRSRNFRLIVFLPIFLLNITSLFVFVLNWGEQLLPRSTFDKFCSLNIEHPHERLHKQSIVYMSCISKTACFSVNCAPLSRGGSRIWSGGGGPQIVTGLKLPFWGLSFVEFWCWGLIFGGQGGAQAPRAPPGSAPAFPPVWTEWGTERLQRVSSVGVR